VIKVKDQPNSKVIKVKKVMGGSETTKHKGKRLKRDPKLVRWVSQRSAFIGGDCIN